jgi:predicted DNA-binding protein (MmcQ/YjbR family)
MTLRELIDLCLTLPAAYEDYPFDDTTPVIKHSGNKKMFALVLEWDGRTAVNLKCNPIKADFLRSVYQDVLPGWHMNKTHWNTVVTGGDVPHDDLIQMITESYDLVKPKERRKNNEKI